MRSATFIKNIVQSNRYFDIKGNNLFIQDHRKAVQYHKVPYKIVQIYKTIKGHKRPQCPRVSTYTMHSGLYMVYTPISNIILLFSQSQKNFWLLKLSTNLSYKQSFRQIDSKLWKIGTIQNRYPIVVRVTLF